MKRKNYLSSIWNSYPAMPDGAKAAGRLRHIKAESNSVLITLERESVLQTIQVPLTDITEILIEGDLVAILPSLEVVLLAPFTGTGVWPSFPLQMQRKWQIYLEEVRRFFKEQNFLEVRTPALVVCPGTEPSLDVFSTEFVLGATRSKLFLPTSPELHMKKALSLGAEKIFEFAPSFRNGEKTTKHLPEFTMLEWYRSYEVLSKIQEDVVNLVGAAADKLQVEKPLLIEIKSVAELFKSYCDFDLKPDTTLEELKALAKRLQVDVRSAQTIDDYFFLIFTEKIEEKMPRENLTFVEKYPPYQAALARLTLDGWGDRFEVYWKGFELANAFHELNDPSVQRKRSEEDLQKKAALNKEPIPLDEEFFRALEAGMPPSAGIALGLERLFMALTDVENIEDLRIFKS